MGPKNDDYDITCHSTWGPKYYDMPIYCDTSSLEPSDFRFHYPYRHSRENRASGKVSDNVSKFADVVVITLI